MPITLMRKSQRKVLKTIADGPGHLMFSQDIKLILESITDGFISVDTGWKYTYVNDQAAKLSLNIKEDLIGKSMFKVHPGFKETIFYKKYKEVMEKRKVAQFEYYYEELNKWYYINVYPAQEGIAVYFTDVTESKEYIKKLSDSEERYRLMVENIKDYAIFMLDPKGNITMWNKGAERILGYSEKEIMHTNFSRFFIMDDIHKGKPIQEMRLAKRQGRVEREGWRRRRDGSRFWGDEIITAVYDEFGNLRGYSNLLRDITERRKTEQALIERTNDLEVTKAQVELEKAQDEALLESIGEGVIATDNRGRIMFLNKRAEEMFALQDVTYQKKYYHEIWTTWDEKGEIISPHRCPIAQVLKSGKKVINTASYYTTLHRKKFPAAITAAPVVFNGKTVGTIVVFRDIRKEKDIDRAKSEFVSLASHQLRTPLTAIKLFVEMLTTNAVGRLSTEQKEVIEYIEESNQKMIQLVDDLLNVSRLEARKLKIDLVEVDLGSFVKGILHSSEIATQVRKRVITFSSPKRSLPLITDISLFSQVVNNLISNAVQYTKPGQGKIEVKVTGMRGKNYCLSVRDNGIGIPQYAHKKIFNKLYRADNAIKARTDGNGLGLYMCKMILESLGGKIKFTSKEGKGTTFYVQLPSKK